MTNSSTRLLPAVRPWKRPVISLILVMCVVAAAAFPVIAQTGTPSTAAEAISQQAQSQGGVSLKDLFLKSFDLFTVVLLLGSLVAWTVIIVSAIEIRTSRIAPIEAEEGIRKLAAARQWSSLREFVSEDDAFVSRVVRAAMAQPGDDKDAVREAAELAAGEESARWFRRIEPLNIIGNLGPLLGLAGTVYGMVLAFSELGNAGGNASPAALSSGIAKALFHTLLGLLLAVPALTFFGFYRGIIDRICTRAMVVAAGLVELLPAEASQRMGAHVGVPSQSPNHPPTASQPGSNAPANRAQAGAFQR